MASTKRARYLFMVREESPEMRKGRQEGNLQVLRKASNPFISTEHRGDCEGFDAPLGNGGFLFDLRDGTSMNDAKKIAEFLNRNLESIGTITFGDAEDIAVEVDNSEHTQQIVKDGLTEALTAMKSSLATGDVQGAIKGVEAVEGWANRLIDDWTRMIGMFR
jgi:hypothetical protein